ncbi:MAG TPA: hypothetical protein HPP54_10265 [Nitrospinae bacterium]|jgi:hypothetical protein|nr:hypothetical protein [Nitrospinota bacterium]
MALLKDLTNFINPSTIDDFKATISKHAGPAQGNRFNVIFTPPTQTLFNLDLQNIASQALSGNFGFNDLINDPRDVALLCESCSFPGMRLNTTEYASNQDWFGTNTPTGFNTEPITFSFLLTNDYYMKKFWERWMASIVDQKTYLVAHDDTFKTDVIIQALDKTNLPIYGVKLIDAFPTEITAVALDNRSADELTKLSVTVSYTEFKPEGAIASLLGGVKSQITGSLRRLI